MQKTNRISILRKHVVNNIPMFNDDETGNPQNEWVKLYDLDCVDIVPGMTAKVYNLEHDPNYQNNDTAYYTEFHFMGAFQTVLPPYDILEGDYVGCRQNGQVNLYRIVKTITTQIFTNCCDYQLICNVTTPREQERLMGCGPLEILQEEDYQNESNTFTYEQDRTEASDETPESGTDSDDGNGEPDGTQDGTHQFGGIDL